MLESVQRRATKLLPNLKQMEYKDRLKALRLPTLTYRRLRGDMIETYKIIRNKYDEEVTGNLLHLSTNILTRGHNFKLFMRHSNTNVRKLFFSNRIVIPWNDLPHSIVNAPSLASFERQLDTFWNGQEFVYNYRETYMRRTRPNTTEELDIEA